MSKLKKPKNSARPKLTNSNRRSFISPLQKGDIIEIIAPGSGAPLENLEAGAKTLRNWGYQVIYDPQILKPNIYLSNSDDYRFQAFKKAMTNEESKAVWCLRGGYGSIRLLPAVQKMAIPKTKKLLIGFSDICSLHAVINQKWKWPSLHASLIDRLAFDKLSVENQKELKQSLTQFDFKNEFNQLVPMNAAAKKNKKITSSIVGGNLVVVVSTLGTPSQLVTKNKIILLEEIGERGYRVDRCLQQMKQAGLFDQAAAVVLGDFLTGHEADGKNHVKYTVDEFFKNLKIPAFTGLETGHGEIQRPLFFGTRAVLTCGVKPQMVVYSEYEIHKPRK
ncbi:MAG: LD-carboxypeptidase [Bdellovibrionaceae bacterium]|nr:LD-carboxypeptidase [Bdellovibrio sp.]